MLTEIEPAVIAEARTDPVRCERLRRYFGSTVTPVFACGAAPFDPAAARILATNRVPGYAPHDDTTVVTVSPTAAMTYGHQPAAAATAAAASTRVSACRRPTSCNPMGAAPTTPAGTDTAGCPERLNGNVAANAPQ